MHVGHRTTEQLQQDGQAQKQLPMMSWTTKNQDLSCVFYVHSPGIGLLFLGKHSSELEFTLGAGDMRWMPCWASCFPFFFNPRTGCLVFTSCDISPGSTATALTSILAFFPMKCPLWVAYFSSLNDTSALHLYTRQLQGSMPAKVPLWLWSTVSLHHACPGKTCSRLLCCCQQFGMIPVSEKMEEGYTSLLSPAMGSGQLMMSPLSPSLAGQALSPISSEPVVPAGPALPPLACALLL